MIVIDDGIVKLRRKAFDYVSEIHYYNNANELFNILNDI